MATLYGGEMPPVRDVINRISIYNICKAIAAHASASAKAW